LQKTKHCLHQGIHPVLEYGIALTCTASKSKTEKTNKIQNQAVRMMTGAMHPTPIFALETTRHYMTGVSSKW
ncbi:hypothetical protein BaRGS_00030326, partial [Batillaria attramentaria]